MATNKLVLHVRDADLLELSSTFQTCARVSWYNPTKTTLSIVS
jgi:hypothetical protein